MVVNIKAVLNPKSGFVVISRGFIKSFINTIKIEKANTLYFFLLVSANYKTQETITGTVRRGELSMTIHEIATQTDSSYDHIQRLLKQLEAWGLVTFEYHNHRRHIILPYYEEHLGRRVRAMEQADEKAQAKNQTDIDFDYFWEFYHQIIPHVPKTNYEEARKAFARLSLKDRYAAARNVPKYLEQLDNEKYAKWAVNYLKDKCFIFPED